MLSGDKTYLRAIEEEDLAQLLAWRNDPGLRRYFREYRELNMTQQKDWFEAKANLDPITRMFSIVRKDDDALMGACGLCYIDWVNKTADFSIYLGIDDLYIDEIYAVDAAKIMIEYAYDELNLNRLWAEIYEFDKPKYKFFNELGFTLEGTHRQTHWAEGRWYNSYFFGYTQLDHKKKS